MGDGRESNVLEFEELEINPLERMNLIRRKDNRAAAAMAGRSSGESERDPDFGKLTKAVKEGIYQWSGIEYHEVRHGRNPVLERTLENYVQGCSYDKDIFRGFDTNDIGNIKVGAVINQGGSSARSGIGLDAPLSSWSKVRSVSKNSFAGDSDYKYHVLLTMKGGTKMGADIAAYSAYHSEHEVLVSGKSKQRVKKVTKKGKWVFVEVEEVALL